MCSVRGLTHKLAGTTFFFQISRSIFWGVLGALPHPRFDLGHLLSPYATNVALNRGTLLGTTARQTADQTPKSPRRTPITLQNHFLNHFLSRSGVSHLIDFGRTSFAFRKVLGVWGYQNMLQNGTRILGDRIKTPILVLP